eukprot:2277540-Ditylum_brightwellii.AAC.1
MCNNVYALTVKIDIANYLHAACFSTVASTWKKAIRRGFFATWPGLDETLLQKHLGKSVATTKGHMKQQHVNVRSTQPKNSKITVNFDTNIDADPDYDLNKSIINRTNDIAVGIIDLPPST